MELLARLVVTALLAAMVSSSPSAWSGQDQTAPHPPDDTPLCPSANCEPTGDE